MCSVCKEHGHNKATCKKKKAYENTSSSAQNHVYLALILLCNNYLLKNINQLTLNHLFFLCRIQFIGHHQLSKLLPYL